MKFLSMGEIMVEMAPADAGLFRMGFAGDTFNTAWYARRLLPAAWDVAYGTVIGTDAVSDDMATFIEAQGVTPALRRDPSRTVGLYMIQTQNGERSFSYWRGQSAAKTLADEPAWLDDLLADRDIIHFSGITLAILAPHARQTLCDALKRARQNGAHVSFDTNLRPRLWEDAQTMAAGLTLGASTADTVLPSFDEEQLAFGDSHPDDTIRRYADLGATTVAVKNGANICHLWSSAEGDARYDPPAVAQVIDSTAAGDSFAAGFLCARAQEASVLDAAKQAATLAGAVIQHKGALAPQIFEGGTQ
ncbi:sugar kinase [Tropicibacter naphthalenivorans]|uniref:2-dehydro-3-deoxygluconokinase n=1 Tax=Tropicibacter naphthalenivorans TaxID=441103 RepID=A0A0P1G2V0_9RHOB|nr:sugar kinase [Tropicibacter naphthalenivorans]CUH75979.1 2-dehydro-3-deoxygluconokinase [Tropicibacter naphthalenivorans]SMC40853.1 2-keto-3-deoxygluconate kinase [Tropicibacter naphthalenivorans]